MATTKNKTPAKSASRTLASKKPASKKIAVKSKTATAARVLTRKTAKASEPVSVPKPPKRPEISIDAIKPAAMPAVPASAAVNAKLADIARTNMNAGLELASGLAKAKSPMEAMRLGLAYWYDNIGVFQSQAQELQALSADLVTMASEPLRAQMRRT